MAKIKEEKQTVAEEPKNNFSSQSDLYAIKKLTKPPKEIKNEVAGLIPQDVTKEHGILFFDKKANVVKVAMLNPQDTNALNIVRFVVKKESLNAEIYEVSREVF